MRSMSQLKKRAREFVRGKAFSISLNLVFISLMVSVAMGVLINSSGRMDWMRAFLVGDVTATVSELRTFFVGVLGIQLLLDIIMGVFLIGSVWGFIQWRATNKAPEKPYAASMRFWRKDTLIDSVVLIAVRLFFTMLWTLLFIVPGIIKQYAYSQAHLLYAEDVAAGRDIKSARAYLKASARMMRGHKMELFILQLSFIGWTILEMLTMRLSAMYSRPYYLAAMAEFYLNLRIQEQKTHDAK